MFSNREGHVSSYRYPGEADALAPEAAANCGHPPSPYPGIQRSRGLVGALELATLVARMRHRDSTNHLRHALPTV